MEGNRFSNSKIKEGGIKKQKMNTGRMSPRNLFGILVSEAYLKQNKLKENVINKVAPRWKPPIKTSSTDVTRILSDNDIIHKTNAQAEYSQKYESFNNEEISEKDISPECSTQESNLKSLSIDNCGNIYNLINERAEEEVVEKEEVAKKHNTYVYETNNSSQQSAEKKNSPSLFQQDCIDKNSLLDDACVIPEFSSHTGSQTNVSTHTNNNNESSSNCNNDSYVLNTEVLNHEDSFDKINNISHHPKNVELDVYSNTKVSVSPGTQTENHFFKEVANIQVNNILNTSVGSATSKNCNTNLSNGNIIEASCDNDPFGAIVSNSQFLEAEKNISTENDQLNFIDCSNRSSDVNLNMPIENNALLLRNQIEWQRAIIIRNLINTVDKLNKVVVITTASIRSNRKGFKK